MLTDFTRHRVCKPIVVLLLCAFLFLPLQGFSQTPDDQSENSENQNNLTNFNIQATDDLPFKPGDGVLVSVFPDTASFLNQLFPIDDNGNIFMPIVGEVQVSMMTEKELVDYITTEFKDYLRYPFVQVRPMLRVSVLGGVQKPGLYYLEPNRSLWDLIYKTGGTLKEEGLRKMRWERSREIISENLIPQLQNGVSLSHMGFRSGDQIWVPSPDARTWVDTFRDILPVVSLLTSMWVIYRTYQRDQWRYASGR